jgi:hypothetical protein
MTATVAEMKIQQLKRELADAEAAQQAKKTIASELTEARAAEAEASRLVRINATSIEQATADLESLRAARDNTPLEFGELRAKKSNDFKNAEDNLRLLQVAAPELAKKLQEKRLARMALDERIAAHPIYQGIRKRQRELVEQAAALVSSLFETTVSYWSRVLDLIDRTEQAENDLISQSMPDLSAAGLPEISPVLRGFFQQAVPHRIVTAIPEERACAFREIARVRDLVSRGMVR